MLAIHERVVGGGSSRGRVSLVKLCLGVLFFGTMVLGTAAMLLYFRLDHRPGIQQRPEMYRKEPTAASLADRLEKLSGPVAGVRGTRDEVAWRGMVATMSLIEGSLGETNMGYQPVVEEFRAGDRTWKNIWADNPGWRNPSEIVEARVAYDLEEGALAGPIGSASLAAGLELAQALAGASCRRTVRVVFLGNERGGGGEGRRRYEALLKDRQIKVLAALDLDGESFGADRFVAPDGTLDGEGLAKAVARWEQEIRRLADQ